MKDFNLSPGMVTDSNYPRGKTIENGTTIIDEHIHRDLITSIQKMLLSGNGTDGVTNNFDNDNNGYELIRTLIRFISGISQNKNSFNQNKHWYRRRYSFTGWNGTSSLSRDIIHSLSPSEILKIVNIGVTLWETSDPTIIYDINGYDGLNNLPYGGVQYIDETYIHLRINPTGSFIFSDNISGVVWIEFYNTSESIDI